MAEWREAAAECARAWAVGEAPDPATLRAAVKGSLTELAVRNPGHSVEVRVPPYAAVQMIEGVRHRRGTPPAVVETDARTWVGLSTGELDWVTEVLSGKVRASGERSDLRDLLPIR